MRDFGKLLLQRPGSNNPTAWSAQVYFPPPKEPGEEEDVYFVTIELTRAPTAASGASVAQIDGIQPTITGCASPAATVAVACGSPAPARIGAQDVDGMHVAL
mmetsp:Transcript_111484/g.320267  ORF Transcript_111484/g.320267 Transcript_111484/m.320267 type:complete len:102 (-) Transcript_111484:178-483(-)